METNSLGHLAIGAHAGITDNADSQTGCEGAQTARQAGSQVGVAIIGGIGSLDCTDITHNFNFRTTVRTGGLLPWTRMTEIISP